MDEDKFSLERFLELMGERGNVVREKGADRAVGRDVQRAHAIDRKPKRKDETPEGAGDASADERGKRAGLLGRAVERVRRTFVRKTDEAVDLDRSRDRNSDRFREAKSRPILHGRRRGKDLDGAAQPRRAGGAVESGGTLKSGAPTGSAQTVEAIGLRYDSPSARMFHVEQSVETDVRERETVDDAEQVGVRVERKWHEDEVPRARERVWREAEVEPTGRARNRRWTEAIAEAREQHGARGNRSAAGLREIAESDSNFAESRGKIAEFRKSDVSVGVDLRTVSRAIERDSRRY